MMHDTALKHANMLVHLLLCSWATYELRQRHLPALQLNLLKCSHPHELQRSSIVLLGLSSRAWDSGQLNTPARMQQQLRRCGSGAVGVHRSLAIHRPISSGVVTQVSISPACSISSASIGAASSLTATALQQVRSPFGFGGGFQMG